MKTVVSVILPLAMALNLSAQNFTFRGQFADVANDTLSISYVVCEPEKRVVNAAVPVDGEGLFTYGCSLEQACQASLVVRSTGREEFLFFVPGERAEVEGSFASASDWRIGGSAFYQRFDSLRQQLVPFYREFDAVRARYERDVAGGLDRKAADSIRGAANRAINRRLWEVSGRYLSSHTDDELSAVLLLNQDYTEIMPAIRRLSPEVRNGRFRSYIDGIESIFSRVAREQQAAAAARLELEEDRPAPDFTLKDINGEEFRLSALFGRGKYVVVDFWGSWCSWCIKGFPAMEEYYRRYGERLEIVGVACQDREERWKAAVRRSNISWLQVFSPDGRTEVRYGVKAYPFKVVLSPEGRVLKCFNGETEAFYKMLDRLLRQD